MNTKTDIDLIRTVAFAVTDPNLLTLDLAKVEKSASDLRKQREKDNPAKPDSPEAELRRLRKEQFELTQNAHGWESRVNNAAGTVKLLEERLATTLKTKKEHEESGNLVGARTCENAAHRLEDELLDARELFVRVTRDNKIVVRALRVWKSENSARLQELMKPKRVQELG
jgi:hypothetical protein